ncbi:YbaN family protein [Anthocerotibacter panamensis]|uniref:DUF454 family protein n=1 Tax=Anthocerotibacter panamensis TaxID=2857077 RepID=UPI001C40351F|nr:DUF454 family protein [Anthocerotibacter panamensis]
MPQTFKQNALRFAGVTFFGMAIIALFIPLVPSTPFFIASFSCFALADKPLEEIQEL